MLSLDESCLGLGSTYKNTIDNNINNYSLKCRLSACAFEEKEDDSLIVTGGYIYEDLVNLVPLNKVTKYFKDGRHEVLPALNIARTYHSCGSFTNNNNEKV